MRFKYIQILLIKVYFNNCFYNQNQSHKQFIGELNSRITSNQSHVRSLFPRPQLKSHSDTFVSHGPEFFPRFLTARSSKSNSILISRHFHITYTPDRTRGALLFGHLPPCVWWGHKSRTKL